MNPRIECGGLQTGKPVCEEFLNSPLFQIAGMFAWDDPGLADRIDEYLAEAYADNHAEEK